MTQIWTPGTPQSQEASTPWVPGPGADYHHICDNLWLGGFPHGGAPKFRFIFNFSEIHYLPKYTGQSVTSLQLEDIAQLPDLQLVDHLVKSVNSSRRLGPTLVHCWAGQNRSGIIAALALTELGPGLSAPISGPDAIVLLRRQRHDLVLSNHVFRNYVASKVFTS